jgi:hypothetical protein
MEEQRSKWQHHFLYRKESIKTTWKFRIVIFILVILIASLTRGLWIPPIARSLVCTEEVAPSDVILVENFEPNYLLFERAAALQKSGFSRRVLIPTPTPRDPRVANTVFEGFVEVMARVARMQNFEVIPIRLKEPIGLNAAYQMRDLLISEHIGSLIAVMPGFRSRRSSLVYQAVLKPAGIQVYCMPVFGLHTLENWTDTWHGIQQVTEQFLKLQFYRFYVLPLSG